MNSNLAIVAFALGTVFSAPVGATVIASQSFESPVLNSPGIQYGPDEFAYNTNEVGPVVIPGVTFTGFSGIIKNGSLGVFPNATDGTQAAFVQSYNGVGGEIDWAVSGLTVGHTYALTFDTSGSFVVPTDPFTVSILGGAPSAAFNPSVGYVSEVIDFTATATSGTIDFVGSVLPGNYATAIDNLAVSSVPEPTSWALMIVGIGFMGASVRRRRTVIAA